MTPLLGVDNEAAQHDQLLSRMNAIGRGKYQNLHFVECPESPRLPVQQTYLWIRWNYHFQRLQFLGFREKNPLYGCKYDLKPPLKPIVSLRLIAWQEASQPRSQ